MLAAGLFVSACSGGDNATDIRPDDTLADVVDPTPDVDTDAPAEVITTQRCPVARIVIAEGDEVLPGTALHLDASQSYGLQAPIVAYAWTVTQPDGATGTFSPSADIVSPTFVVTTQGFYTFKLTVTDDRDFACAPAEQRVFVTVDDALRIELSWANPNDPDVADDIAPDLDLHFLHPLAVGGFDGDHDGLADGWFDLPFDCFWSNESPNWGNLGDTLDNPVLTDSTTGGPETLRLPVPEDGATYRIGVHVWDDRNLRTSYATVRIYLRGMLAFEAKNVALEHRDMWTVTSITWPPTDVLPQLTTVCAGSTTTCTSAADCSDVPCGPRIAQEYVHPEFFPGGD